MYHGTVILSQLFLTPPFPLQHLFYEIELCLLRFLKVAIICQWAIPGIIRIHLTETLVGLLLPH